MVNLGLNFSSLLGIILAIAGAGLYFLRSWKPKLARDHDIFFAAVGLLCGGILLFQGWRLDPILAFGQFLLTGSAIFFAVESIRLRAVSTTKARERAPIVDDERYVSDVYRVDAELDELEPMDEYTPMARQIRGSRDSRPSREELYYDEEVSRRRPPVSSRSNRSILDKPNPTERPRKRRPSRPPQDDWETPTMGDDREYTSRSRNRRPSASDSWEAERWDTGEVNSPRPPKPRRSRPPEDTAYRNNRIERIDEPTESHRSRSQSSDYTDYRPVEEESDNRFDRPYDLG